MDTQQIETALHNARTGQGDKADALAELRTARASIEAEITALQTLLGDVNREFQSIAHIAGLWERRKAGE